LPPIVTATIAHLARSTPERYCFNATDFNSYVTVSIADGAPKRVEGFMSATDRQFVVLIRSRPDTSQHFPINRRNFFNDISAATPLAEKHAIVLTSKVEFF